MTRRHLGIGPDGKRLPYDEATVERMMRAALERGDLLLAVLRAPNGDLYAQTFAPPSIAMCDLIDDFAKQYRAAVMGALDS